MKHLHDPTILLSCALFVVLCSSACSSAVGEILPEDTRDNRVDANGIVSLPEASWPFITVEEVDAKTQAPVLRAPARVSFRDGALSRLGAPLQGRVERVHVRTGDRVEVGDTLVTLDCPEAASARAALASARAAEKEAAASAQRVAKMVEQGVGTMREKLAANRAHAEAVAELERAQAVVRFVGKSTGNRVFLRSPIRGTVVSLAATVGAAVEPSGEPLVEVGDPKELWVVADVFERDLHLIAEGQKVAVELPGLRDPLHGQVVSIAAMVESGARTASVRIDLLEHHDLLRPGMFGRARIESAHADLALPTEAVLIKDGSQTVVYVRISPGRFEARPVVVGQPIEGRVLIASGIEPGDQVVVKGALLLDGAAAQLL